jgi:hypothetical protein
MKQVEIGGMKQAEEPDPRNWPIYRNRRGRLCWYQRWFEAWWIVNGKWSLHRAWQDGVIHGTHTEYTRIVINGGDLHKRMVSNQRVR